jgi:hypothetical protein
MDYFDSVNFKILDVHSMDIISSIVREQLANNYAVKSLLVHFIML